MQMMIIFYSLFEVLLLDWKVKSSNHAILNLMEIAH